MDVLRKAFEKIGFENVKTVIASGNVLFEAAKTSEKTLEEKIEKELPNYIGFRSNTIVRTIEDVQNPVNTNPFKSISLTPTMRPHVTFLKHDPPSTFKLTNAPGLQVVGIFDTAICYVIDTSATKTPDVMRTLDKEFLKNVTTRTWKTIERIAKVES